MMKRLLNWLDARFPLTPTWKRYFGNYYVPKNLNFWYCFGALAVVVFINQLLTGIWLTMFYTPTVKDAFDSIEYIMRDVHFGWLLRYSHSTGASAFFIVLYLHLFRGLLYGSYQKPRELVWILGVGLFLMIVAEAFFGYLLPWGQMSYWGAEVITSFFSVIPYVGDNLVTWIRGDYAVSDVTLHRFFALHVTAVPLGIVLFVFLHVVALHQVGSNNPQGIEAKRIDMIPFHPYYMMKDFIAVLFFLVIFLSIVFFFPNMGGYFLEPDNFTPANALLTPEHITPVWYMAPFYAMLRAIPNKALGIIVLMSSILILFGLPWLDKSPVRSLRYKGKYSKCALSGLVISFLILGYVGKVDITPWTQFLARLGTFMYFGYFLLMPIYTRVEQTKKIPERII